MPNDRALHHARLVLLSTLAVGVTSFAAAQSPWHAQYFPNVELITQAGDHVRFYDLIKGKTVAIELFYTQCQYACPLETARLGQVQSLLGEHMGKDVFFYSISIDPTHDTPAALRAFANKFQAGPGWTFLTGAVGDIDLLSKKLGLYSPPDPDNKDGHMPTLLIGNEAAGQWMRGSALDNPKLTATMITNWLGDYAAGHNRSYAAARPITTFDGGRYVFSTKCAACHTIGQGASVGPDLAGITATRDRQWLVRYIGGPDDMLRSGDPIARRLLAQYGDVRMPNLELTEREVAAVIEYLESHGTIHP